MQGQFLLVTGRSRRQALKSSAAPSKISASAAANGAPNSVKSSARSVACSATIMIRKRRAPFSSGNPQLKDWAGQLPHRPLSIGCCCAWWKAASQSASDKTENQV